MRAAPPRPPPRCPLPPTPVERPVRSSRRPDQQHATTSSTSSFASSSSGSSSSSSSNDVLVSPVTPPKALIWRHARNDHDHERRPSSFTAELHEPRDPFELFFSADGSSSSSHEEPACRQSFAPATPLKRKTRVSGPRPLSRRTTHVSADDDEPAVDLVADLLGLFPSPPPRRTQPIVSISKTTESRLSLAAPLLPPRSSSLTPAARILPPPAVSFSRSCSPTRGDDDDTNTIIVRDERQVECRWSGTFDNVFVDTTAGRPKSEAHNVSEADKIREAYLVSWAATPSSPCSS